MSTQFTRGLWAVTTDHDVLSVSADGFTICTISTLDEPVDESSESSEDVPNAHLIAAAPDLYAALERIEWTDNDLMCAFLCPECGNTKDDGHTNTCAIAAALAKARGDV